MQPIDQLTPSASSLTAVGTILGIILIAPTSTTELPAQLSLLLQQYDLQGMAQGLNFQMPGVDWPRLETEWANLKNRIPEPWKLNTDGREFQVGSFTLASVTGGFVGSAR